MKKATKILFSTALTAGMLFTGVQLWNLQAQEETSNKKEANTGITLQEAAATTTAKQNGDLLRKRDGSCLDENNTATILTAMVHSRANKILIKMQQTLTLLKMAIV